jgi:hypothetical protein
MARAFWQHKTSGDVFAVELNDDGTAWAAVGPLYYDDVNAAYLADLDVSTEEDAAADAAWLNDQPCKIVELEEAQA